MCCGDTALKKRHILLLESDTEQIAEFVGQQVTDFAKKVEGRQPFVFEMKKTRDGGQCLFLRDNKCTIYPKKPIICRFYPFELRFTTKKKFEFRCTTECPGVGKGRLLSDRYFRKLFQLAHKSTEA